MRETSRKIVGDNMRLGRSVDDQNGFQLETGEGCIVFRSSEEQSRQNDDERTFFCLKFSQMIRRSPSVDCEVKNN